MTGDAWDPEPCERREGADSDVTAHAATTIALLREGARDGTISREAARESIARIRDRDRDVKGPGDDGEGELWD